MRFPFRFLQEPKTVSTCVGALALLLTAFAGNANSGCEFSISASPTDPFMNSASPSGGVRNIYLWLTCGGNGISAFEGSTSGSLSTLSFVPQNGVLNVGGATDLLLAIPGCPDGEGVNIILGYWIVQDTGGTLCLGPSPVSDTIAFVDCEQPNPSLWDDPIVLGFASSGAPCEVGTNECGSEDLAFGAQFEETIVVKGSFPGNEPWAPLEPHLVFNGDEGLYVLDAGGSNPPRLVVDNTAGQLDWSPDGQWIVFTVENSRQKGVLYAAAIDGSATTTLAELSDLGHFLWATDGYIYYWDRSSGSRQQVDPPQEWRDKIRGTFEPKERVVPVSGSKDALGRSMWPCFFEPTRLEKEILIPKLEGETDTYFIIQDEFPTRRRFLATRLSTTHGESTAIVDFQGRVVRDFGTIGPNDGFYGTSVSSDGRYVIGQSVVTDGHDILQSTLWIADLHQNAPVRLDGSFSGMTPKLSPSDSHLAFTSLGEEEIHVGRLVIYSR